MDEVTLKKCSACFKTKSETEFYTQGRNLDTYCKPCRLAYNKDYKAHMTVAQRERLRETNRASNKRHRENIKLSTENMANILRQP